MLKVMDFLLGLFEGIRFAIVYRLYPKEITGEWEDR